MWLCNRLLHCASSASTVNNDNDDSGSDSDSITSDIHIRVVELYHYPKEYTVVLCPAVMQIEESCRLSLSLSLSQSYYYHFFVVQHIIKYSQPQKIQEELMDRYTQHH